MSNSKKLAIQTVFYGFSNILGRLINYLLVPFYTRVFIDPSILGTLYELFAYLTFLNVIYAAGFETGYFYFSAEDRIGKKAGAYANGGLLINILIFSSILIPFSNNWADLLHYHGKIWYVVLPALILIFDTLVIIPFAYLRKEGSAKKFSLFKFLSILLNVFFNIIFLVLLPLFFPSLKYFQEGETAIILVFSSFLIASVCTSLFLIPEFRKVGIAFNTKILVNFAKYSLPILVLGLAGMVNETLDRILLKPFLRKAPLSLSLKESEIQLGIYSASYKLSIFMTLAIQSFRYAAEPFFFKELRNEGGKQLYATVLEYFSFITALIFLSVSIFMPWIKEINGKTYQSGSGIVPILLLANLFLGMYYYLSQWYKQTGKTLYGAYLSFLGAAFTILVNIIFIPYFGYYACAYATLGCYFLMALISYYLGKRHYPTPMAGYKIFWNIAAALIIYGINSIFINQLRIGTGVLFFIVNFTFIAVYLFQYYLLEKEMINTFIQNYKNGKPKDINPNS